MPNLGDFDPAEAIQGLRQQRAAEEARKEAEEQRRRAQEEEHRANILELLRYADKQLENTRDPVVSEFVITERWWECEQISNRRGPEDFKKTLRPDQQFLFSHTPAFFSNKRKYTVATRHYREKARYHGSWLSLGMGRRRSDDFLTAGLVKLRQPRAGYAYAQISGNLDLSNVCYIFTNLNVLVEEEAILGRVQPPYIVPIVPIVPPYYTTHHPHYIHHPDYIQNSWDTFQILASLEAAEGTYRRDSVEQLTKYVQQALDFVATGQPPEPVIITGHDYN